MAVLPQQRGDDDEGENGEGHQRSDLPLCRRLGEEAKCGPGVLHMRQLEEAGDDQHIFARGDVAGHRPLGDAVQQQYGSGDEEEVLAHGVT